MEMNPDKFPRLAGQVALGSSGVAVITAVCFAAHLGFAVPCLLYMLLVVVQSLWGGFLSAAIVSVIASACLEYFFIPPVLEWQISDPEYGFALVTYLITSLVITRLASRARNEALVAERRRSDAGRLYDVASQLLALEPENATGPQFLRIFREVFALRAVCFYDADATHCETDGAPTGKLADLTRESCAQGVDHRSGENDLFVRCLRSGGRVTGAVGLEGHFEDEGIAKALLVLAATTVERMRSFSSASKAAADAQAEMLRSALLDAFAHEFKTPLAIILAAAGGLRETEGPGATQTEMTDIIENQTLRLNQLTTRLLRIARLDRSEIKPHMEEVCLNVMIENLVDQYQTLFGRRISAASEHETAEVMADPELLSLALSQLLDNACKYSIPEAAVVVRLDVKDGSANVRISNEGPPIRPEERERIFERFFRGSETEQVAPGAGLGLYVARKIVRAHGGNLELDRDTQGQNTTFRISLPLIPQEQYENEAHQSAGSRR